MKSSPDIISKVCKKCEATFEVEVQQFEVALKPFEMPLQNCCDKCIRIYEQREEERLRRRPTTNSGAWSTLCPPCYRNFQFIKLPPEAQRIADDVISWKMNPRGVGLLGKSRAGKTFLMYELFRRLYEQGTSIHTTSGPEMAFICGDPDQKNRRILLDRMMKAEALFIDDLGKEKITERFEADLYHVLEHRRRFERPVFVTVNSGGAALASRMSNDSGAPIMNRLREDLCDFITLK